MDILAEGRSTLERDGYASRIVHVAARPALLFEDDYVFGFLHVFETAEQLLSSWQEAEQQALSPYSLSLKRSNVKAWNVYSIFATSEECSREQLYQVMQIDENLEGTRKIARACVSSQTLLAFTLLPILSIQHKLSLSRADYNEKLRSRLQTQHGMAIADLLLRDSFAPTEMARMLIEEYQS